MKSKILFILLIIGSSCYGQHDERISTLDFVQILNDNEQEAIFYYQNNWMALREVALEKEYIESYQFLVTPASEEEPFHYILITTYQNEAQYKLREEHFTELIEARGELDLLNSKKPNEFRKVLFSKEMVQHLN